MLKHVRCYNIQHALLIFKTHNISTICCICSALLIPPPKKKRRPMGLDALLKNQLGHGPKVKKLHIHFLSIPGRRNWVYFRSMGSGFWDCGWFSKLPYLANGHETWPLAKIPEVAHTLFLSQGLEIELMFALRAAVSEILADFQIFHIWAWIPEVTHILSFYPQGVESELIFALRTLVSEIRANFQNYLIWAWNLASG